MIKNYLFDKNVTMDWLRGSGLIARTQNCIECGQQMKLVETSDRSDGFKWECQRTVNGKRHTTEVSIRKNSF